MRLCMMIYGSLDTLTGGFLYDKFLVEYLRRQGHSVDIVSLPWRKYGRSLLDNLSFDLRSTLGRNKYDLILQDELIHPSLFWLNHQRRKINEVPIVSIVHQVLSSQPRPYGINQLLKAVEKNYLASVDAFIFNSETTRRHVQHLINRCPPSVVANPGPDRLGHLQSAADLSGRAQRAGPLELVFVGNITPIKGLIPLIESLAKLPPYSWRLTVVGDLQMDLKHVRRVRHMIAAGRIDEQVRLKGALDGEDLKKILAAGHLLAMPFAHEGFGIACLEALAFGLPVLASTAGAAGEFIRDGVNGYLIPPGETRMCARIISDLHRDRRLLLRLSEGALQTARARPGWSDTLDAIHYFLTHLPKQHRKPGTFNRSL